MKGTKKKMDIKRKNNKLKYCVVCEINIVKNERQQKKHYHSMKHKHNLQLFRRHTINQQDFEDDSRIINNLRYKNRRKITGIEDKTSKVYITGLPEIMPKDSIEQYFSKFGTIQMVYIKPAVTSLTIQYEHEDDAKKVVNMKHIIDGKELVVQFDAELKYKIPPREILMLHHIQNYRTLDMQIGKFLEYETANDPHMLILYQKMKCDMAEIMGPIFPSCVIWPFGSATTCLQFVSSNIDLFLEIKNDEDCAEKARKALTQSPLFESVLLSPPYIECVHVETSVKCVLNFTNIVAVKSSELIRYYVSLDTKIRPFILLIKYWAKSHELTGKQELFTNYSLVILCIFYLQQKHSFPSVRLLHDPKIVWNTNISMQALNMEGFEVKTSMRALLEGFFAFYADFDYESTIISPYLGAPVEKTPFLSGDIPEEFHLYKHNLSATNPLKCDTPICLQDPLEHNVNICSMVSSNALSKYVKTCTLALSKFSDLNETNMLHRLFSTNENERINEDLHSICIWGKVTDASTEDTDLIQQWFHQVKYFLVTVFEKIFKFDMNIENNEENHTLYKATCFIDVWTVRDAYANKIKDKLQKCRTILAKQILLTDLIWSSSTTKTPNSSELFQSFIRVSYQKNPTRVFIKFDHIGVNGTDKENYVSFFQFFKSNYGIWFERYTKELDEIF